VALTVTTFRDRFPAFTSAPDALVQACLDEAYDRTPANVWGGLQDAGAGYLAAHLLGLSPNSRDMKLASVAGETIYGIERRRLNRIVASGARVAGMPAELEALDTAVAGASPPSGTPALPPDSYVDAGFFDAVTPYTIAVAAAGARYVVAPTLDIDGTTGWTYASGVWTYGGAADLFVQVTVVVNIEPASGGSTNLSAGLYYDGVLEPHDQGVAKSAAKASGTIMLQAARTFSPGQTVELRAANEDAAVDIDLWSMHWNILPGSL